MTRYSADWNRPAVLELADSRDRALLPPSAATNNDALQHLLPHLRPGDIITHRGCMGLLAEHIYTEMNGLWLCGLATHDTLLLDGLTSVNDIAPANVVAVNRVPADMLGVIPPVSRPAPQICGYGEPRYFSYSPDTGIAFHESESAAHEEAKEALDGFRSGAEDTEHWAKGVSDIVVGVVLWRATNVNVDPAHNGYDYELHSQPAPAAYIGALQEENEADSLALDASRIDTGPIAVTGPHYHPAGAREGRDELRHPDGEPPAVYHLETEDGLLAIVHSQGADDDTLLFRARTMARSLSTEPTDEELERALNRAPLQAEDPDILVELLADVQGGDDQQIAALQRLKAWLEEEAEIPF